MNNYYSQEFLWFVDGLIEFNARCVNGEKILHINDLTDTEQKEFAAHLIKHYSLEGEGWDWLYDSDSREELANHFAYAILECKPKTKSELFATLISDLENQSVHFFKSKMQDILEERIWEKENKVMTENGFRLDTYPDNGETYWRKAS